MTRVLVVDDDRDVGESTVLLVESLGHEAEWASEPAAAVDQVGTAAPDLILQDVSMPGLDDLEDLVRRLRAVGPSARLYLFTGRTEAEEMAEAAGADGVLRKPCDMEQLAALLEGRPPPPRRRSLK